MVALEDTLIRAVSLLSFETAPRMVPHTFAQTHPKQYIGQWERERLVGQVLSDPRPLTVSRPLLTGLASWFCLSLSAAYPQLPNEPNNHHVNLLGPGLKVVAKTKKLKGKKSKERFGGGVCLFCVPLLSVGLKRKGKPSLWGSPKNRTHAGLSQTKALKIVGGPCCSGPLKPSQKPSKTDTAICLGQSIYEGLHLAQLFCAQRLKLPQQLGHRRRGRRCRGRRCRHDLQGRLCGFGVAFPPFFLGGGV